jgi:hypothetical protein
MEHAGRFGLFSRFCKESGNLFVSGKKMVRAARTGVKKEGFQTKVLNNETGI